MKKIIFFVIIITWLAGCKNENNVSNTDFTKMPWDSVVAHAKGTTVNLTMWQGDPYINKYMQDFVIPNLKSEYNIDLKIAAGQGNEVVKLIMNDLEARKATGNIDLLWINGETFFQLRQVKGLYGPFVNYLPNAEFVDFENKFIGIDFQQPIDNMECPWGNVQLAIIYDSVKVPYPPKNMNELADFVKSNPGKFTIPYEFTGLTLLKSWLIAIAGGGDALAGDFDEKKYNQYSAELWKYINSIKADFWKNGETFPNSLSQLHQMYANGELLLTMSNNDGEVDNKVMQGLFPLTSRAYVFNSGTIQNSHYMGITYNAPNIAGAMVVCNFLMSPEAQYEKMKPEVWGDGTILNLNKLSAEWQQKFNDIPSRQYAPKRSEIQQYALMEIAPEYMIRLFDDFRTFVIEK